MTRAPPPCAPASFLQRPRRGDNATSAVSALWTVVGAFTVSEPPPPASPPPPPPPAQVTAAPAAAALPQQPQQQNPFARVQMVSRTNPLLTACKPGDVVSLEMESPRPLLKLPQVLINGQPAPVASSVLLPNTDICRRSEPCGWLYVAARQLSADDPGGPVQFLASGYQDESGLEGQPVSRVTAGAPVIFDKTPPCLTAISVSAGSNAGVGATKIGCETDTCSLVILVSFSKPVHAPLVTVKGEQTIVQAVSDDMRSYVARLPATLFGLKKGDLANATTASGAGSDLLSQLMPFTVKAVRDLVGNWALPVSGLLQQPDAAAAAAPKAGVPRPRASGWGGASATSAAAAARDAANNAASDAPALESQDPSAFDAAVSEAAALAQQQQQQLALGGSSAAEEVGGGIALSAAFGKYDALVAQGAGGATPAAPPAVAAADSSSPPAGAAAASAEDADSAAAAAADAAAGPAADATGRQQNRSKVLKLMSELPLPKPAQDGGSGGAGDTTNSTNTTAAAAAAPEALPAANATAAASDGAAAADSASGAPAAPAAAGDGEQGEAAGPLVPEGASRSSGGGEEGSSAGQAAAQPAVAAGGAPGSRRLRSIRGPRRRAAGDASVGHAQP